VLDRGVSVLRMFIYMWYNDNKPDSHTKGGIGFIPQRVSCTYQIDSRLSPLLTGVITITSHHNYYNFDLIRSLLLAISFLHRIGISAILTRILSSIILSHSSKTTYFSSLVMRQSLYRFLIHSFRIFQMPSLGFRSGDYTG